MVWRCAAALLRSQKASCAGLLQAAYLGEVPRQQLVQHNACAPQVRRDAVALVELGGRAERPHLRRLQIPYKPQGQVVTGWNSYVVVVTAFSASTVSIHHDTMHAPRSTCHEVGRAGPARRKSRSVEVTCHSQIAKLSPPIRGQQQVGRFHLCDREDVQHCS